MTKQMLSKVEQEQAYEEIMKIYDLSDEILMDVEDQSTGDPALKLQLVRPLVEQIHESTGSVADKYIDFCKNEQKATKSDVNEVESSIRKVFTKATDFIVELKKLPSEVKEEIPKDKIQQLAQTTDSDEVKLRTTSSLLPIIGYKVGQLIPGPIRETLTEQMLRLPKMKKFLYSVRETIGQFFRLTYFFLGIDLINNQHNVIWGRKIPDLKAQAMLEQEKSRLRKEQDLLRYNSHIEFIRNQKSTGKEIDD